MTRIAFSFEELIEIVIANGLISRQIVRVRVKGERIHFVIKTNSFILPFIPASLRYLSFDDGNALFELAVVTGHANKAIGWLSQVLELKIPAYMKLEYPRLTMNVDKLLEDRSIRGVRVKDIFFENGEFVIVTGNI
ncbi:MAG: hypothetical protein U9Q07_10735 [Planctomycetota bacterium]|nr:hypothetical protein [Planctomycetota bacterium]